MDIGETTYAISRGEWRAWLADNHAEKKEVWLILYKKGSGKPSISHKQAVEEAICYGWIDSQSKSIDHSKYAQRFSPRRADSHWSDSNRARALRMLREGKITSAGMATLPPDLLRAWRDQE